MAVKKDEKAEKAVPDKGTEEPKEAPNYDDKFKSFEETISKQGETIEQLQQYVTGSSAVINTIATDENLRKQFQESYRKQTGVQSQQQEQGNPQAQGYQPSSSENSVVTEQVNDVVTANRDTIVRDFEKSYGINELTDEERKTVRQKVATYLGDFGWEVNKLPLTSLRDSLDKAYMGSVGYEKLKEEGKLEGVIQARQNAQGVVGSFPSGAPQTSSQVDDLTSKQKDFLTKLKVKDVDGAKKTYQDRDNEQDREKEYKE